MLENGSNFYMPVAPANGGGFGNGFGGDGWWILLTTDSATKCLMTTLRQFAMV